MTGSDEEGPLGQVVLDGEKATLVFERRIAHPYEAVWRALTDPAELSRWHMMRATIDGREGGASSSTPVRPSCMLPVGSSLGFLLRRSSTSGRSLRAPSFPPGRTRSYGGSCVLTAKKRYCISPAPD
jgi:hypothetical protein